VIYEFIKQIGKPLLGFSLLVLIVQQLDISRLADLLRGINWWWFVVGFLSLIVSNLLSAYRWSKIAAAFGIEIPLASAIKLYAQGITANTLLPGGIVGGDVWRTLGLVNRGATKVSAALSVFFDRLSGVWVLGICSLVAFIPLVIIGTVSAQSTTLEIKLYIAALFLLALVPVLLFLSRKTKVQVLVKTFGVSLIVQLFALIAFWACFKSLGEALLVAPFVAVCAGIFIAAVIPAAIGGFGARELAAVVFMEPLGISAEVSFAASVLYGLMATLQGLMSFYWWLRR
jgi:uncharacterized membrane protein YbhN (UPF0104 family)